jgi:hypothetical protein
MNDNMKTKSDALRESITWDGARSKISYHPEDGHLSLVFDGPRTWLGFVFVDVHDAYDNHFMRFAVEVLHQYAAAGAEGIRSGMLGIVPMHCATVLNMLRFRSGMPAHARLSDLSSVGYADALATQYKNIVNPSPLITDPRAAGIDLSKLGG